MGDLDELVRKLRATAGGGQSGQLKAEAADAITSLREALEPFAARADAYENSVTDFSDEDWPPRLVAAFRRARTALNPSRKETA